MNAVFPSSRPNISVRVIPKIPATMHGVGGIGVSKEDGVWTITPKWDDLLLIAPGTFLDPATKEIWVHDPITDIYNRMTLAGLGQALFWGTSTTSVLIGAGPKTFITQSNKDWPVGSFIQAFSTSAPANFVIGQITSYVGTTMTMNALAIGGAGSFADWTLVMSTLPGGGAPGATGQSAGLNYRFVASLSGDPGSGNVGFNSGTIASITAIHVSKTDRNGVNIAAEVATWDDSTSILSRARVRVYSPDSPANFVIATINGLAVDGGTFFTFPLTAPVGVTMPFITLCQVEILRTGDRGDVGPGGIAATIDFTPAGNISAITVQGAIEELDHEKVAKAGDTMSGQLNIVAAPTTLRASDNSQYEFSINVPGVLELDKYTPDTFNPASIEFGRARGSFAGITAVANGDWLGWTGYQGYDGSTFVTPAGIAAIVDGAIALNTVPTSLSFWTGTTEAASDERMLIKSGGQVVIHSIPGGATNLHVGAPNENLICYQEPGFNSMGLVTYANNANSNEFSFTVGRGTGLAPAPTQINDVVGLIDFYSTDNTLAPKNGASISAIADGAATATGVPTALTFSTGKGDIFGGVERLRIGSGGLTEFHDSVDIIGDAGGIRDYSFWTGNLADTYAFVVAGPPGFIEFDNVAALPDSGARMFLARGRGSLTTPTPLSVGDITGSIVMGTLGPGSTFGASIEGIIDGAVSSGIAPSALMLKTGNASRGTERIHIASTGQVAVQGIPGGGTSLFVGTRDENFVCYQEPGFNAVGVVTFADNGNCNEFSFTTSRGTKIAPAAVQLGDTTALIDFYATDTTLAQKTSASINIIVDAAPDASGVPQAMVFKTGKATFTGDERIRIASGGQVTIAGIAGGGSNLTVGGGKENFLCYQEPGFNSAGMVFFGNNANGVEFSFNYGRGTNLAPAAVQIGDVIGLIDYYATDTSLAQKTGTSISTVVDAAVNAAGAPAALIFNTSNGSVFGGTERMRIASNGNVTVAADPSVALGVATKQYVDARGTTFLQNTAVFDPPSLTTGVVGVIQTITVTGAALGDLVAVSFSVGLQGMTLLAWVSATNTVSYQFQNKTAGTIDLASGTVKVRVIK